MKLKTTLITALIAIAVSATALHTASAAGNGYYNNTNATLTPAEAEIMVFMREEEKLARDVYDTLYTQWQLPIFNNISAAEQKHTNRVQSLLQTYGITDPVTDDTTGVFITPELSDLYQQLLAKGGISRMDALQVGALVEETDIMDLQQAIANSTQSNVSEVYNNLMRASRNHLRAFVGQIQQQGGTYIAQVMPQAEVDAIINSPRERGNGGGQGHGQNGQGKGKGQQRHGMNNS